MDREEFRRQLLLERAKAKFKLVADRRLEEWKTELQRRLQRDIEYTRAVFTFAGMTVRTMLILNGGAIITVLTFVGNLLSKPAATIVREPDSPLAIEITRGMPWPLVCFANGLVAAALATAFAYFAQMQYASFSKTETLHAEPSPSDKSTMRTGKWFHGIAIGAGIVSAICFAVGFFLAIAAFWVALSGRLVWRPL